MFELISLSFINEMNAICTCRSRATYNFLLFLSVFGWAANLTWTLYNCMCIYLSVCVWHLSSNWILIDIKWTFPHRATTYGKSKKTKIAQHPPFEQTQRVGDRFSDWNTSICSNIDYTRQITVTAQFDFSLSYCVVICCRHVDCGFWFVARVSHLCANSLPTHLILHTPFYININARERKECGTLNGNDVDDETKVICCLLFMRLIKNSINFLLWPMCTIVHVSLFQLWMIIIIA